MRELNTACNEGPTHLKKSGSSLEMPSEQAEIIYVVSSA